VVFYKKKETVQLEPITSNIEALVGAATAKFTSKLYQTVSSRETNALDNLKFHSLLY